MYPRFAARQVAAALADTRVVLVEGPRQAGKTTLVEGLSQEGGRRYFSLDDPATLALARGDPVSFVRNLDYATIDEVQRAPELLLAIKRSVDRDPRPGRFLLTGSAKLMTLPRVADSLAGRMEILRLLPLAQAELLGRPSTFLDEAFRGRMVSPIDPAVGQLLTDLVVAGGYPEALTRRGWARRAAWHESYLRSIISRDVADVATVDNLVEMPRLVQVLAEHSGQLVNYASVATALQMNQKLVKRYTNIFAQMFLVRILPPWSTNRLQRLVKTPKLHFVDTGMLSSLQNVDTEAVMNDRKRFGPMLETFVVSEVFKLASWYGRQIDMYHFRDRDQHHEVDMVLEGPGGAVVGIEVKAAATVTPRDFKGLEALAAACGPRFKLGVVLFDHDTVIPRSDKLFAAPVASLWA